MEVKGFAWSYSVEACDVRFSVLVENVKDGFMSSCSYEVSSYRAADASGPTGEDDSFSYNIKNIVHYGYDFAKS